jgi:hypothetical protein
VKGLIPILLHSYSEEQLKPFFTPPAFAAGKHLTYDPSHAQSHPMQTVTWTRFSMEMMKWLILSFCNEAPDDAPGGRVFGQRLATALTEERYDDDTISTLHNGDNTGPHRP